LIIDEGIMAKRRGTKVEVVDPQQLVKSGEKSSTLDIRERVKAEAGGKIVKGGLVLAGGWAGGVMMIVLATGAGILGLSDTVLGILIGSVPAMVLGVWKAIRKYVE
jgi:hypothetical protein